MIYTFLRYLKGYVRISVRGYSVERFINLCSYHGIVVWNLIAGQQAYEMNISIRNFRELKPIIRKTKTRVGIVRRVGFPFFLHRYRRRKSFFVGMILCICLIYFYSTRIWSVDFDGNQFFTKDVLLEFLDTRGVVSGMQKSEVDCAAIVHDIREEYDGIVWVSASIDGSRLHIQVKENEDAPDGESEITDSAEMAEQQAADLIAAKKGVITKIITRRGVPQVHPGDSVEKGALLVLGRVEVRNDSDEVIGYQYQKSDADIYASTEYAYEDTMKKTHMVKEYTKKYRCKLYFAIGNWMISIGNVKTKDGMWEIHTEEQQIELNSSFKLPVIYGIKIGKQYVNHSVKYTKEQLQNRLSTNFQVFCEELVKKEVQITSNSVKILIGETEAKASGTISVIEPIGETRAAEVIDLKTERDLSE